MLKLTVIICVSLMALGTINGDGTSWIKEEEAEVEQSSVATNVTSDASSTLSSTMSSTMSSTTDQLKPNWTETQSINSSESMESITTSTEKRKPYVI